MNAMPQVNEEQALVWNGVAGRAWVETQALLDHVLKPFEDRLTEAVAARRPRRLLDVGCGTGATTIAASRVLGAGSVGVGVDISEPMIESARARAAREGAAAEFIRADAQTHAFSPAAFDMIVSRFGVMFFDDAVGAFANLRRAATEGAALCFLAWRGPAENPFMTTAERAAAPLLPDMPVRDPDAPGQFALADRHRIERVLAQGGWTDVNVQPFDVSCSFPASELTRWFTQLGPLGRALQEADEAARTHIVEIVRRAFEPYVHGDAVRFDTASWIVFATAARSAVERNEAAHG